VLLIRSPAFGGAETRLTPAEAITLIGVYGEERPDWSGTPIETASAKPYSAPKLAPRKARAEARRIGATLFAVIMTLIVVTFLLLVF
jgi:hypothetical protein